MPSSRAPMVPPTRFAPGCLPDSFRDSSRPKALQFPGWRGSEPVSVVSRTLARSKIQPETVEFLLRDYSKSKAGAAVSWWYKRAPPEIGTASGIARGLADSSRRRARRPTRNYQRLPPGGERHCAMLAQAMATTCPPPPVSLQLRISPTTVAFTICLHKSDLTFSTFWQYR